MRIVLATAGLFALVGCTQRDADEAKPGASAVYWNGNLTELDGRPVANSGINIEITSADPRTDRNAAIYRLTTGCTAGGFVGPDGRVRPMEVLRPCRAEDIALLGRLNQITGPGLPSSASEQRLTWARNWATLASSAGEARFTAIQ